MIPMFPKTDEQLSNLTILAEFLERVVPPPHFNISSFVRIPPKSVDDEAANRGYYPHDMTDEKYATCGSTACAVGHGPLAGIPPNHGEDWWSYCKRVFGVEEETSEWNWLFDSWWAKIDNTAEGASARIKWYLLNKGTPYNMYEQVRGVDELCYTDLIVRNTKEPVYIMETPKND